MNMKLFTTLLVFCGLAAVPATAAAASWKSVGTYGSEGSGGSTFGVDSAGNFTILFRGRNIDDEVTAAAVSDRAPRGKIGESRPFPTADAEGAALDVAPGGARTAYYATGPDGNRRVEFRTRGRKGGEWSAPTVISQGHPGIQRLTLRVSPSGQAVLVWYETPPQYEIVYGGPNRSRYTMYASTRSSASAAWSPPKAITEGLLIGFDLEIDDDGNALLAWVDDGEHSVKTMRRRAGGDFGAPEVQGEPGSVEYSVPAVAVAPSGKAIMSWVVERPDGVGRGTAVVTTGTTTKKFPKPMVISRKGSEPLIAIDDRLAAVSWVENLGSSGRVRALLAGPREDIGDRPAITVSAKGVRGRAAMVVTRGRVGLAWSRGSQAKQFNEARTADSQGKLAGVAALSKPGDNTSLEDLTANERGEVFVALDTGTRTKRRAVVVGASASTGRFGRPVVVGTEKFLDQVFFMPPGRGGSMYVAYIAGNWHLSVYE